MPDKPMNPERPAKRKSRINIGNAAALLVAATFAGQLLGFLRTKLINSNFLDKGPHSTDAFFAAFSLPDFFFFTLAAGALGVAFMPALSDQIHRGNRQAAWKLSSSLMNLLALIMFVVGVIMLVFAKPLIHHVVAPGLREEQLNTATTIMRLMAFNPLLFSISGVLTSMQQTMGRFFFYAMAPLFYNLSIIVSIFLFKNNVGLVGLGIGALSGGIIQLIIVAAGLWKFNFRWHPRIDFKDPEFRTVLRNLPPRSLDQGVDQVENIVETHIASGLGTGSITYYTNAFILSTAPILLIGTAISTAAFPRLNARLSQNRPDLFRKDFLTVLRAMIWIAVPTVVVCYFGRGYLARLIYARGNIQIANIFGYLTLAIYFRIIYTIISRWFYSQKDTVTPLMVSLIAIALNVFLAVTLARPSAYGLVGLGLAQSIVAVVEVFILSSIMLKRDHKLFDMTFWGGVVRIMSVAGFTVVAGYTMIQLYPLGATDRGFFELGSKLVFIASVTFAVHIAISALFGLEEVRPIFARLRKLVFKPVKVEL